MQDRAAQANGYTVSTGLKALRSELCTVREHVLAFEEEMEPSIASAHPEQAASARNLVDYLALRQLDLRALQDQPDGSFR